MKKTIITSAILLFTQIAIFAQTPVTTIPSDASAQTLRGDKGKGNQRGKDQKEKQPKMTAADRAVQYSNQLKTVLTLNDDQYQKVLAVNTECITRKDAMKGSGDKGAMKTGKSDIKAYRLGEFKKIFTAQQMTIYQNMNENKDGKNDNDGERDGRGKGKSHGKDDRDKRERN